MTLGLINANPVVHAKKERIARPEDHHAVDALDIYEFREGYKRSRASVFDLEQLSVLSEESITVDEKLGRIQITFTPTIQHCSMATVIGLCLREKLKNCFPPHFKVDIKVAPGSHADEDSCIWRADSGTTEQMLEHRNAVFMFPDVCQFNKQLNDKEWVAAATENPNLRQLVDECLYSSEL